MMMYVEKLKELGLFSLKTKVKRQLLLPTANTMT